MDDNKICEDNKIDEDDKIIKKRKIYIDAEIIEDICKCIICHDYISQKGAMCCNSHYTCLSCYNLNNKKECSYCKQRTGRASISIPYKLYEGLELEIKCPYDNCEKKMLIKEYHRHKESCPFRYYKCIHTGCNYVHDNVMEDVIKHYVFQHKCAYLNSNEQTILYPITKRNDIRYEAPSLSIYKLNDNILLEITASFMMTSYVHSEPDIVAYPLSLYIRLIPLNHMIDLKENKLQIGIKGINGYESKVSTNENGLTCIIVLCQALIVHNYKDYLDKYMDEENKKNLFRTYDKYKSCIEINLTKISS